MIEVIGISLGQELLQSQLDRVVAADYLIGGDRLLSCFPDYLGQKIKLGNLLATIDKIKQIIATTPKVKIVVLASGDPLLFGIGRLLLEHFPPAYLQFSPSVSSIQLAFARLKIPWQDAIVVSSHGRSLRELEKALRPGKPHIAILTDAINHPLAIANFITALQLPVSYQIWVCENLGDKNERVVNLSELIKLHRSQLIDTHNDRSVPANMAGHLDPTESTASDIVNFQNNDDRPSQLPEQLPDLEFAPLNVVVLSKQAESPCLDHAQLPIVGIADQYFHSFSDQPGLITKREIRLLALGELELQPGQVIWDIGAGTGSLSIEMARLVPAARIYAIEKTAAGATLIAKNMARFQVDNIEIHQGKAPKILADLPNPDRIFIGGSSGELAAILQVCCDRLAMNPQSERKKILVANFASPEHLHLAMSWLKQRKYSVQLLQVNLARSVPIGSVSRFAPLNPVTILKALF
ncbi:precorrin-6Y C5,15-methyltransferase (decarboxylating) [Thalassoporum mexicanum PCC 7367]|uniref:bifunctional cobalt-precorrin-7 (C(5))-methyltransferase/cobalt-precorrin-6B (C(15))-methyltransferase n=1 Tax=Thalassoporum mexicanum TaxID=3457544 RepID=UPI00029F9636|nr:bifunctional cobalt-precorrin-7 (C(5))-methyltransferase/cobalt-precorrin-6B (C(15))-methyltransferase [Pseudanabaena sp. PCC 7367]AFY71176.1 precorrin-6Y C5,15-methyltransferase (decarboxylating) [Pseudanabaena sp. PCC 7367]